MPRNYRRNDTRRRRNYASNSDPIGRFFKRPAVQLSILGIALLIAITIVLFGQP